MEVYDYSNKKTFDDLSIEVDCLTEKERMELSKELIRIREKHENDNKAHWLNWFESSILPILKEFAEMTESLLEIDVNEQSLINISLKNNYSINITENCMVKFILQLAQHISVEAKDNEVIFSFTFDCNKYI
ncbi:MAG TPA: hypothetical protein IAA04_10925 [Candidatus Lachnoclostridium pullistercoris]|uniref:Uncharacterized protein n=1 Tax=Candidatus Lachnoclostridium pullistercoris TaxID=2838632 RepID=A0A9D2T7I5_9FIRM|nr:hypothetical protein [Candidatus Lachnoclostridium pullistercoris]